MTASPLRSLDHFKRRSEIYLHLPGRILDFREREEFFDRRTTATELEWIVAVNQRVADEYARQATRRRSAAQVIATLSTALMTGFLAMTMQSGRLVWLAPCPPLAAVLALILTAIGRTPNVPVAPFPSDVARFKETFKGEARLMGELRLLRFERIWQECDLYRISTSLALSLVLFGVFLFLAYPLVSPGRSALVRPDGGQAAARAAGAPISTATPPATPHAKGNPDRR